ncbi:DUF4136 domain-containing protein [Rubrolithibacter danxiaensis]|uniref:DUF4136 domain-containing protein n=1 Tax=Rubrolithibacter danxiaensis TaxID=3390805 RepID=UPI003BF7FCE9
MKKLLFLTLFIGLVSAGQAQVVDANKALDASISSYKTYDWIANIDKIPDDKIFVGPTGVLIYNNESGRKMIKDAIMYELDARGYKKTEGDADMLLSFMVLEQPGKLRTYNGYQVVSMGSDTVRTPENVQWTNIKAGTLIINITNNQNKMVWQGFASGILTPGIMKDESKVRQAVSSIFRKFKYKAAK